MKTNLDGNALCITHDDFINLQISPAFFIEMTPEQIEEFNCFMSQKTNEEQSIADAFHESIQIEKKIHDDISELAKKQVKP